MILPNILLKLYRYSGIPLWFSVHDKNAIMNGFRFDDANLVANFDDALLSKHNQNENLNQCILGKRWWLNQDKQWRGDYTRWTKTGTGSGHLTRLSQRRGKNGDPTQRLSKGLRWKSLPSLSKLVTRFEIGFFILLGCVNYFLCGIFVIKWVKSHISQKWCFSYKQIFVRLDIGGLFILSVRSNLGALVSYDCVWNDGENESHCII